MHTERSHMDKLYSANRRNRQLENELAKTQQHLRSAQNALIQKDAKYSKEHWELDFSNRKISLLQKQLQDTQQKLRQVQKLRLELTCMVAQLEERLDKTYDQTDF